MSVDRFESALNNDENDADGGRPVLLGLAFVIGVLGRERECTSSYTCCCRSIAPAASRIDGKCVS